MTNSEYFEKTRGYGVLATANDRGIVDAAMYSKPYFIDDCTAVFIMAERLSYENLKTNPYATYLFIESTTDWSGKRLYLKKFKEEVNNEMANQICEKCDYSHYDVGNRNIVFFNVQKVLPLVGGNYESYESLVS